MIGEWREKIPLREVLSVTDDYLFAKGLSIWNGTFDYKVVMQSSRDVIPESRQAIFQHASYARCLEWALAYDGSGDER